MIKVIALFSLIFSINAGVYEEFQRNKQVIIVYGKNAPPEEEEIAQKIYDALELSVSGDLYEQKVDDQYALLHKYHYNKFHLIIVGTAKTNALCNELADIQNSQLEYNTSKIPALAQENRLKKGIFSARYGYFQEGSQTGIIRRSLNPFALETYNISDGQYKTGPMTATYIYGTDQAGLVKAYIAFLDSNLLEGVLVDDDQLLETASRYKLAKGTTEFPMALDPKFSLKQGANTLRFVGWIQGALADYSGSHKLTGITPQQICHLKFAGKQASLMTYDDHSNSVLALKFKDPKESLSALQTMAKNLKIPLKIDPSPKLKAYRCTQGQQRWLVIRRNNWLLIENLPLAWKEVFLQEVKNIFKY